MIHYITLSSKNQRLKFISFILWNNIILVEVVFMSKLDNQVIGERIRFHREKQNKVREEFAEAIGVTGKFCSDIENGSRGMSIQTLERISDYLHLSTDYILFGDAEKESDQIFLRIIERCPEKKKVFLKNIMLQLIESYLEE